MVVGGGPAGAAAAITGACAGLSVVLFDARADDASTIRRRRSSPGEAGSTTSEEPGETVHPAIETVLDRLGLRETFLAAGFARYDAIAVDAHGMRSLCALGADESGPWRGHHVHRSIFDAMLRERARAAGAEVRSTRVDEPLVDETRRVVGVRTGRERIRARFVIDASGRAAFLARRLEISTATYSEQLFATYGWVEDAGPSSAPPLFRVEPDGWTWQARVDERKRAWVRVARCRGAVPTDLERARPIGRSRARDVTWRLVRPTAGDGYLLAGDTAARLDPAWGQGILRALVAGIQAARVAEVVIHRPAQAQRALVAWDRWVVDTFEDAAAALAADYAARGIALSVSGLERAPPPRAPTQTWGAPDEAIA